MKQVFIDIFNKTVVNVNELAAVLRTLKDGRYLAMFQDYRKRSDQQNKYYWAVVVPYCMRALYEAGYDEIQTVEDCHEFLLAWHLKRKIQNVKTGEVVYIQLRSSKLTIPEFNDYIETICRWAAEYLGIYIPAPNEAYQDLSAWNQRLIYEYSKN